MPISNKRLGNQWESLFERSALRSGISILRIHDGCRRVGLKKIIPVKQPCDWVMSFKGRTALIDTKTIGSGSTFMYSHINFDQVKAMSFMAKHGTLTGFCCWFRDKNRIVLFNSQQLMDIKENESLHLDQGLDLGTLEECELTRIFDGTLQHVGGEIWP